MLAIVFPSINPIALQLSIYNYNIGIYWYGIAYVVGIISAQFVAKKINNQCAIVNLSADNFDKLIVYLILGIILGGRIGYILFYMPLLLETDFFVIFNIRGGGLSFHGGLIGVTAAILLFCYKNNKTFWGISDIISCVAPIGIFFGRIANFVNAELVGRNTDVVWGVIFPNDHNSRHPSQLYEACIEGLLLFIIMQITLKFNYSKDRVGKLTGLFLLLYALFRFILEFWRQPDNHIGFFMTYFTLGQLLSIPMFILGGLLINFSRK